MWQPTFCCALSPFSWTVCQIFDMLHLLGDRICLCDCLTTKLGASATNSEIPLTFPVSHAFVVKGVTEDSPQSATSKRRFSKICVHTKQAHLAKQTTPICRNLWWRLKGWCWRSNPWFLQRCSENATCCRLDDRCPIPSTDRGLSLRDHVLTWSGGQEASDPMGTGTGSWENVTGALTLNSFRCWGHEYVEVNPHFNLYAMVFN